MSRVVVLEKSTSSRPSGYDVQLGLLSFVTPANLVGESVGDGLDVFGASLVGGERKPRPLKLQLPIRGYHLGIDPRAEGLRLRRQVRQLMNNSRLRLQGMFFTWEIDPDLDAWLQIGSGEINSSDPGISFGEYGLELSEVYLVGRPGTHRPGRRAAIADRRLGTVPRDSRGLLYSTDFATNPLPVDPLFLPGDIAGPVSSGNRPVSTVIGPERNPGARHVWTAAAAVDQEIVHYRPDDTILPERTKYQELDDLGSVRVWDLSGAALYPPDPTAYSGVRDTDPDIFYAWEQVYGSLLTPNAPLAIDNGACRLIWLGPAGDTGGLAVEFWDNALGCFHRIGRILHAANVREQRVVELTTERAVLEWRSGSKGMRAILQRGWWGPRMESYDDGGGTARLEYEPIDAGGSVVWASPLTGVHTMYGQEGGVFSPVLRWAQNTVDETYTQDSPSVLTGPALGYMIFTRPRVLVGQLAAEPGPAAAGLMALNLVDARPVPILIGRS